jgi:hypothetical protein
VSDLGPTTETLRDTSPLLRFSAAMRWPRDRREEPIPDEDDGLVDESALSGRLAHIETRIGKLAERFDQLEFVIVEQFEPGMTEAGELPSGNLRDRLDRIEEGLGLLHRTPSSAPATWDETMAADEDLLDAAAVEARLDDIAARLAELAEAARPQEDPPGSAVDARLDEITARLAELAEAAQPRDGAGADALEARLDSLDRRLETVAAEAAARHEALLTTIVSEGGTSAVAASAAAEAREQALLATLATEAEDRHAALLSAMIAAADARYDAILSALDRAMNRPPPSPDLTLLHRGFAGFATALQTTLNQFETSVDSILARLDGMAQRLEAVEARIAAPPDPMAALTDGAPPVSGLEISLGALSEGIGALVRVLGTRSSGAREAEAEGAMLDQLGALVTAAVDAAARDNRTAMDETLRDLRLALAEVAADNLRLRIA